MPASTRPVRIANCSGFATDPGQHMHNQAVYGDVDVITGDYLAEVNLATTSDLIAQGKSEGWLPSAWEGIQKSLEVVNEKRIKIVVNGGGLNPKGLAEKTHQLVQQKRLNLRVAYVEGDDLFSRIDEILDGVNAGHYAHLDAPNPSVQLVDDSETFLQNRKSMPAVSANAYLGYRAISKGLHEGADIVICGRVADASPVMAAAAWWHGWDETAYDELAGALVAGHLIECSTYVTGGNFAGFFQYGTDELLDLGLPIAEVSATGETVITKHEVLNGIVTSDTVKCQFLYELQGNVYLNSDVKADISDVRITDDAGKKNRVRVTGIKGYPPPPTTKLAVFYRAGYQCEMTVNATGYATPQKWDLQEAQVRKKLLEWDILKYFDVLDFQRVGAPLENPDSQLASTSYLRVFAQAKDRQVVGRLAAAWRWNAMAHFAGMHSSLDMRTLEPIPFLGYYPVTIPQSELDEAVVLLEPTSTRRIPVGPPRKAEPLGSRENFETPIPAPLEIFGPTEPRPLGDIALARSGDKGGNVNIGIFVHTAEEWDWLRSFMTREQFKRLMGRDWRDWYHLERVEFPHIYAVHFVVYGLLGRGVSSSRLLDGLGKGFAEFIRAVHVPVPRRFLGSAAAMKL